MPPPKTDSKSKIQKPAADAAPIPASLDPEDGDAGEIGEAAIKPGDTISVKQLAPFSKTPLPDPVVKTATTQVETKLPAPLAVVGEPVKEVSAQLFARSKLRESHRGGFLAWAKSKNLDKASFAEWAKHLEAFRSHKVG